MKILLLSHGMFARELVNSCMFIVQNAIEIEAICLDEEGIDKFSKKLNSYLNKNKNKDSSILFFCDLKHGSPYNQLLINLLTNEVKDYRIISGMNLPMLLQAITMREVTKDLNEIAIKVNEAGIEGVCLDEQEE